MLTTEIVEKISSGSSDSSGRHCKYYQLNDSYGLKVWRDQSSRDYAYKMQKAALDVGLAPGLGDKIAIPTSSGTLYGYVTEHLEVVSRWLNNNFEKDSQEKYEAIDEMWVRIDQLVETYDEHFLTFEDTTLHNVGIMASGNLCAIDFGDFM